MSSLFANYQEISLSLDKTSSHIDGPNCWNGALYAANVLKTKRFINPEEWLISLREHCQEVENPIAGDVGRLFHKTDGEVHGFIHLDESSIFAKHGESSQHGYQIMSYAEMLKQYGKTRSCRMSGSDDPSCIHELKYYRCHGQVNYPSEVLRINQLLEEFAFSIETKWRFKENCDGEIFQRRDQILYEIADEIKKLRSSFSYEDKALMNALAESYSHQVYNMQISQSHFRCADRAKRKKSIDTLRDELSQLRELLK